MKRSKLWLGAKGRTYSWNETREAAIRLTISIIDKIETNQDWHIGHYCQVNTHLLWEFTRNDTQLWNVLELDKEVSRIMPKWLYDKQAPALFRTEGGKPVNALGFVCGVMYRMLTGRLPEKTTKRWTDSEESDLGYPVILFINTGLKMAEQSDKKCEEMLKASLGLLLHGDELKADDSPCTFAPEEKYSVNDMDLLNSMDKDIKGLTSFLDKMDLEPIDSLEAESNKQNDDDDCEIDLETGISAEELRELLENLPGQESDEDEDDEASEDENGEKSGPDSDDFPESAGRPRCNVEFRKARPNEKGFADVAGMDELKQKLEDEVLFVLKSPFLAKRYRLHATNGMILYGPPGCGKTFLAEKFAIESGMSFALIKSSDLGCTYIHGSQTMIADLFRKAAKNAPCVLCFDEIDALLPRRSKSDGSSGDQSISSEVNEMLTQLNNCSQRGIFVIGTTNEPESIDPAILRAGRLEEIVYVPLPDAATRRLLFSKALEGRPLAEDIDLDALAAQTEGYVSSDITLIADKAALRAAKKIELISMDHLREVIGKTRRSIAADDMKRYQRMKMRFENNDNRRATQRPRIGFAANYQEDIR